MFGLRKFIKMCIYNVCPFQEACCVSIKILLKQFRKKNYSYISSHHHKSLVSYSQCCRRLHGPFRISLLKWSVFSWHSGPTGTFFAFFSSGNDEAVADTSRRVGGAVARKSDLKSRLNDAIKQLQATERGKDRTELKPHLFVPCIR